MLMVLHSITTGAILGNFIIVTGSFVLLMVLLRIFAWKHIVGIFDARADKISKDLERAETARTQAENYIKEQEEALKASRLEASRIVGQANARASHDREAILSQAKEEAQAIKDKAKVDAEQIKADAIEAAKEEVAKLAIDLAERILLEKLDASEKTALVDRYLDRLGEN